MTWRAAATAVLAIDGITAARAATAPAHGSRGGGSVPVGAAVIVFAPAAAAGTAATASFAARAGAAAAGIAAAGVAAGVAAIARCDWFSGHGCGRRRRRRHSRLRLHRGPLKSQSHRCIRHHWHRSDHRRRADRVSHRRRCPFRRAHRAAAARHRRLP